MGQRNLNIISGMAVVGCAASLWFLYQARASVHERDVQLRCLRDRMAQLENDVLRLSSLDDLGLTADAREAYLSLGYKEFDATYDSGHRRFRDQPRNTAQAAVLIEAYLERHAELSLGQRMTLHYHAAQLFAMDGMTERAITHLERARTPKLGKDWNNVVDATQASLLLDREGLLSARRRMTPGGQAEIVDHLIERFGESYGDLGKWEPICSTVNLPAGASPDHRAAADELAKAIGPSVAVAGHAPAGGGIPGDCIWLEVRSLGGTPDVEGYIILHANKSTVITATNEQQLHAAVKRFSGSSRERNGKRDAPFGLATSFQLAR